MALIRNALAGVGCLTVLVVGGLTAWLFWDDIQEWWTARSAVVASEPSEALAVRAEEKLGAFFEGDEGEVRVSEVELQSYLRFRMEETLPRGVHNPAVELRDSTVALSVDLDLAELAAASSAAENLRRFMGDSTRVNTELYPRVDAQGRGAVTVMSIQAGLVPLPPLLIPNVLAQTGLETTGGRTILLHLPSDMEEIRIDDDHVTLRRKQ